ncbi:lysophospholipid acyltransferase family protein [Leekyejoonella antrihumi]|nr:lysophospholipid acyltransferase family protein [Leekyejoonella antrihumi]
MPEDQSKSRPARKTAARKATVKKTERPTPGRNGSESTRVSGRAKADTPAGQTSTASRKRPPRSAFTQPSRTAPERALRVVPDPVVGESGPAAPARIQDQPVIPGLPGMTIEAAVNAAVWMLRAAGSAAGLEGAELERRVAQTLAFVRRRLTGDYDIDDFGFDADFTEEVWLPLLRPLYQHWFRVEVRGIENIPDDQGALVVANHSGSVPIDGLMTQVAIHDAHRRHRYVRSLGADLVFQSPLVGSLARKAGATLAANPDAERLLASGELTMVFPEGFKGIGKPFGERYRLQRFGRGGFVTAALRAGAPIIPCSIVGAEEIFPMMGNAKGLARMLGFPYFPITPTFPLLGPLGAIPLPSKWIIEFGEPIETASYGVAAAEDPMVVLELSDQVRETIQQTLYSLLSRRRSVFF